ncbi:MAG: hypothetical protein ITG07_06035 [Candidimonas sp.]|nr:hypothetical protein [Candidimonas sp.]
MATKPTTRKQPFVIEPLNWVAPAAKHNANEDGSDESKQTTPAEEGTK